MMSNTFVYDGGSVPLGRACKQAMIFYVLLIKSQQWWFVGKIEWRVAV